jgi:hypothetical protein
LVEHSLGKGEVTSSILVIGSIGFVKTARERKTFVGKVRGRARL